jgi:hypothetical protein
MRACGFQVIHELLECASLRSVKREVLVELVPGLKLNVCEALFRQGNRHSLQPSSSWAQTAGGCVWQPSQLVRGGVRGRPEQSGTHLLQARLDAFFAELQQHRARYDHLDGHLPALHKTLLSTSPDSAIADTQDSKVADAVPSRASAEVPYQDQCMGTIRPVGDDSVLAQGWHMCRQAEAVRVCHSAGPDGEGRLAPDQAEQRRLVGLFCTTCIWCDPWMPLHRRMAR